MEAEQNIQYAMPVRMMNYEVLQYEREYKFIKKRHRKEKDLSGKEYVCGFSGEDRLPPVISVALYLGKNKWDAPSSLYELMHFGELNNEILDYILPYCNDFRVKVLDIITMKSSEKFQSDLREVFGFLIRQKDKEELVKYVRENKRFFCLSEEAYDIICAVSGTKRL